MPIPFEQKAKFTKGSIKSHEACTIVGKKGTGKSVLFDILMDLLGRKNLIVLIDSKREYEHIPVFTLDHVSYDINEKTGKKIYARTKGVFRIYEVDMGDTKVDDLYTITEWIAKLLFERENCIMAVEELGNCTKKYSRLYDCNPMLARVIQQGRARNVGFLGTTQRLQEIHTTILSESDHIICFRLTSEQDEKYMRNYIKPEYIQDLGEHEFLHLNLKQNYLRHCWRWHITPEQKKYYTKIFGRP